MSSRPALCCWAIPALASRNSCASVRATALSAPTQRLLGDPRLLRSSVSVWLVLTLGIGCLAVSLWCLFLAVSGSVIMQLCCRLDFKQVKLRLNGKNLTVRVNDTAGQVLMSVCSIESAEESV